IRWSNIDFAETSRLNLGVKNVVSVQASESSFMSGSDVYSAMTGYNLSDDNSAPGSNALRNSNPQFAETENYSLSSNSPAKGSGGPITTATSSGSGNTIKVEDAIWFHDGYGLTEGDKILVRTQSGTQRTVITSVPDDNTIVVRDQLPSWQAGAWINFDFGSTSIDRGYYPFSFDPPPPPGKNDNYVSFLPILMK
ncbi:MAG: hypothetical protein KDJ65_32970, partial [Anaerolineae bacterium]|nr:hypothetical protein [Anaerolineae bacterium]